ncbi:MAG: tetratricopeptide repeat protein [Bacteroidales bacterium]|nr:tetratricopeptide repeat protein [Bacteroidales bacterium]
MVVFILISFYGHTMPYDLEGKRNEIDSLLKILPIASDENRVEVLIHLSKIYLSISMDSSREYARLALKSAKDNNNNQKIAEAYKLLGNISYYKGNYNNVVSFYDSSLTIYKLVNDSFGQSKLWNNLGIIYHNLGDFQRSIDYHLKSLDCKIKLNDSIGIANSFNNIGSIYFDLKNFEKSSEYFSKALDISLELGNSQNVQSVLNNLGMISLELQNLEKALDYFKRSIEFGERVGNQQGIANSYHNMGQTYFYLANYKKALELYMSANEKYEGLGIKSSETNNNIGQAYLELDYYNQALFYLNDALLNAKQNNQFIVLRDIYKNLSVVYQRTNNFEKAYVNYILFNQYDDSIKDQSYSNSIEELLTKNKLDKQNEQIEKTRLALEKSELEIRKRNLLIYSVALGLVSVLIFALIILRLLRQKNKSNEVLSQQNTEILRSQEIIKKINKALTENEEKLRSIFEVSPYSILIVDTGHTINDCNETSGRMFNIKNKREILGKKLESLVKSPSGIAKDILLSIEKNQQSKYQYELKRPDESTFSAEITGRMINDASGNNKTFLIVIADITERLEFIENLEDSKLKAEESDRLKTAFLANMSHEIRTPMNSIIGFSNLLNEAEIDPGKKDEYLSHILQSSSLLLSLIDDIIDISKIEAGQLNFNIEEFNLNKLVEEVFKSFSETNTNSKLTYTLNIPSGSDSIMCKTDPLRLKQILTNLLGNAIKFTEQGNIDLKYKTLEAESKGMLEFRVKDTGIGISSDKLDIIFERFRQLDDSQTRSFGGTGLGLAISQKLVRIMGGAIWVESEPGKGSQFYFTIPSINQKKTDKDPPIINNRFKGYNWKGKTLLVAEDENSNYELIKATLQTTKARIIRATNGSEAFEKVKANKSIDLVLMDIRMPKVNGYDATRMIKSYDDSIPVIAITAYAMIEDEEKSILAGCDFYISKPIRPTKLLETLNGFLS